MNTQHNTKYAEQVNFMDEFMSAQNWSSCAHYDQRSAAYLRRAQFEYGSSALAASTLRGYRGPWRQCRLYVASFLQMDHTAVYPLHFAHLPGLIYGFLAYVLVTTRTKTSIVRAAQAVRFAFEINGFQNPTEHTIVKTLRKCAARRHGNPLKQSCGIRSFMVTAIVKCFAPRGSEWSVPLYRLSQSTMIAMGFVATGRFDTISWMHSQGFAFGYSDDVCCGTNDMLIRLSKGVWPIGMLVYFVKSKTDQTYKGVWVPVAAVPDMPVCAVRLVCVLLSRMATYDAVNHNGNVLSPDSWLFRKTKLMTGHTQKHKKVMQLCAPNKRITYDQALRVLRAALIETGATEEAAKGFGWHGIRAGANSAAFEGGVPMNLRAERGRWKYRIGKRCAESLYRRIDWRLQIELVRALYSDWKQELEIME